MYTLLMSPVVCGMACAWRLRQPAARCLAMHPPTRPHPHAAHLTHAGRCLADPCGRPQALPPAPGNAGGEATPLSSSSSAHSLQSQFANLAVASPPSSSTGGPPPADPYGLSGPMAMLTMTSSSSASIRAASSPGAGLGAGTPGPSAGRLTSVFAAAAPLSTAALGSVPEGSPAPSADGPAGQWARLALPAGGDLVREVPPREEQQRHGGAGSGGVDDGAPTYRTSAANREREAWVSCAQGMEGVGAGWACMEVELCSAGGVQGLRV